MACFLRGSSTRSRSVTASMSRGLRGPSMPIRPGAAGTSSSRLVPVLPRCSRSPHPFWLTLTPKSCCCTEPRASVGNASASLSPSSIEGTDHDGGAVLREHPRNGHERSLCAVGDKGRASSRHVNPVLAFTFSPKSTLVSMTSPHRAERPISHRTSYTGQLWA